jgi:hypothetical protein
MLEGGRYYPKDDFTSPKTAIGYMDLTSMTPELILPSDGDSSYPGLVLHDGLLWVSYYSSHDHPATTAIYLAKVRINP